ncbi:MAG: FAD-binding protein [Planctomycetia bacterium]|nr:FAD-binding protein [Planctomycetia bacterium]
MAQLTTTSARLQDDLRGLIEGDAACDEVTLQLYSMDAGMFQVKPLGVVWPRTTADVQATVRYAADSGIPVHARGSGTSTTGGALGPGLVIDFTRFMHRLVSSEGNEITVQPGAVRERLNVLLRTTKQHFFAPSAGHFPTSTIGSILSTDCIGPRWLRYGFPHDHVKELQVVTPDGRLHTLRPEPIPFATNGSFLTPAEVAATAPHSLFATNDSSWRRLIEILRAAKFAIREEQTNQMPDSCGYRLEGVVKNGIFDPARLFVGSEGTLGIITGATLTTSPLSNCSGAIIFLFDGLDKAARSVETILQFKPTLCDMIDRRIINMLGEWDRRFLPILPSDTEVALVVEFDCDTSSELNNRMNRLTHQLRQIDRLSFGSWFAFHQAEKDLFRDLLRKSKGALLGIRRPFHVATLLEDLQVPVARLSDFLHTAQNILKRHGVTYSISGHLGHGQVQILPILDGDREKSESLLYAVCCELFDAVRDYGGTTASATGSGLARTLAIPGRYPKLSSVFVAIKDLLDPDNIFNPGKIVNDAMRAASRQQAEQESNATEANVKSITVAQSGVQELEGINDSPDAAELVTPWHGLFYKMNPDENENDADVPKLRNQLELQLRWEPRLISDTTYQCSGCGLCRIRTSETRMCPVFRHSPNEVASCRAKVNLLRGILDGLLPLETLTEEDSRKIADFCNFCHCCQEECPALVDVPKLVFHLKNAYNASHGMSLRERFLTNIDGVLTVASFFHKIVNYALGRPFPRWLLEKCVDIPQGRKLPRLERSTYLSRRPWRRRVIRTPDPNETAVALFLDTYSNHFDPRLAEAAVRVLEHNGIKVIVPPRQKSSGHPAFTLGNADLAERIVRHNVNVLTELVRRRYRIVTIEPVSAVCLRHEYPYIRDDEETAAIAANTTDICNFLYELYLQHKLQLDLNPIHATVGYHAPCRTLALTGGSIAQATPAQELLHLIPELNVVRLERGCCGLGGLGGMTRQNYKRSLKLGMPLTLALRDPEIHFGACECNTCKMQMEQRTDKLTLHPLKLLAYSYGLMREEIPMASSESLE